MAGDEPKGICPHCGGEDSAVGSPCAESVCKRQDYHYIPAVHAEAVHGASGPGAGVDPQIGRKVDRYIIVATIGAGGMGSVYLALQMPLEREVALKMVSGVTLDETAQGRFEREAKAISMLYHPNIVQLYEYGFNPATGTPFMALEYVKGGRELMSEIIGMRDRRESWAPSRVKHIFGQVLSALQTAHSKDLVHRDIKPQNIMLVDIEGNPDFVKILDFGLARTLGNVPGMDRLTGTGTVVGTPQYMAPEQLIGSGAEIDRRSDLYGVGAILFEVATGLTAYPGTDPRAVLSLKLDAEYDPMERIPEGSVPEHFRTFLLRACARDPSVRFDTAAEMREALFQVLEGSPPLGAFGIAHEDTLDMAPATPPSSDQVDVDAATVASDDLFSPPTEQLSAFERPSAPSSETLESEIDVPGKVPGRLVLAGTLTGVAILAIVLLMIFVIVPRMRTGPDVDRPANRSFADAVTPTPEKPSSEEVAIAAAMDASTAPSVEERENEESVPGKKPRPKPKPHPKPVDASTTVSKDPPVDPGGTAVGKDPVPKDTGPSVAADPKPVPKPGPPMKMIHARLKALTPAIRQCLSSPQGQVTVGAVFDSNTGKVKKVKVSGFYSGGDQAKACIVAAVKTVEVPPFEGADLGVPYTYAFGPTGDGGLSAEKLLEAAVKKKFIKAKGWIVACTPNQEGKVKVRIKVKGSTGKVIVAQVLNAPFANTPAGECMEKALEKVVIFPTFNEGEKTFTHTYVVP